MHVEPAKKVCRDVSACECSKSLHVERAKWVCRPVSAQNACKGALQGIFACAEGGVKYKSKIALKTYITQIKNALKIPNNPTHSNIDKSKIALKLNSFKSKMH